MNYCYVIVEIVLWVGLVVVCKIVVIGQDEYRQMYEILDKLIKSNCCIYLIMKFIEMFLNNILYFRGLKVNIEF